MTTGTRSYGDVPVSLIGAGWPKTYKFCYHKTWSGGDNPKPSRVIPVYRQVTRQIWVRDKKRWPGDKKDRPWRLVTVTTKIRQNRTFWDPPPRRKSTEWHAYSVSVKKRSNEEIVFDEGDNPSTGAKIPNTTHASNDYEAGSGFLSDYGMLRNDWTANDDLKLLAKLKEKLQGSDFNASVFLGEGLQTLRLLADSAIRIRKALTHLRRGDIAGTARSLLEGTSRAPLKPYKDMPNHAMSPVATSNNWLELQYGWLPLLQDVEDGAHMLAHQLSVPLEKRYRATRTVKFDGRRTIYMGRRSYGVNAAGGWFYQFSTSYYQSQRTKRMTVFIKEKPSAMAILGLTDPASVMWELTPWSFVADWFIPIGQYLEVRGLANIYKGQYGESSLHKGQNTPLTRWRNSNGANLVPSFDRASPTKAQWEPPGGTVDVDGLRANSYHWSYTRGGLTDSPSIPLPTFKPLGKVATWAHAANAIALLVLQFGSSSNAGRVASLPEIRPGR